MSSDAQTVVEAVMAVHATDTPNNTRAEAQGYLEDFKANSPQTVELCVELLQPDMDGRVRHFALSVIIHLVKNFWSDYNNRQTVRELVVSLFSGGTRNIFDEELYVKEKLAECAVVIARSDWPDEWPEMLEIIVSTASGNDATPARVELVLLFLRNLGETLRANSATFHKVKLASSRRRAIREALTANLENVGPVIANSLATYYPEYQSAKNQQDAEQYGKLTRACMEAVVPFMSWAPVEFVAQGNFVPMMIALLQDPQFRELAVEGIQALLRSRYIHYKDRGHFLTLLDYGKEYQQALGAEGGVEEVYEFHRLLIPMLVDIAYLQMEQAKQEVNPNFGDFIQILLFVSEHPSLVFQDTVVPFWTYFVRDGGIDHLGHGGESIYEALLQMIAQRYLALLFDPQQMQNEFATIDVSTEEELEMVVKGLRDRYMDLMRAMCQANPPIALAFSRENFFSVLSTLGGDASDDNLVLFEAATQLFKTCIGAVPWKWFDSNVEVSEDENEARQAALTIISEALDAAIEFESQNPEVISRLADAFAIFGAYLTHYQHQLPAMIEKLFSLVAFHQANENSLTELSPQTLDARECACKAIVRVASTHGRHMVQALPQLMSSIQELMSNGMINSEERALLMQTLVALSNYLRDDNEHSELLATIVEPLQAEWTSDMMNTVVVDAEAFLGAIGLIPGPGRNPNATSMEDAFTEEGLLLRTTMLHTLNAYRGILKQVGKADDKRPSVLLPILNDFLPNLFNLVRTLHTIQRPEVLSQLEEPFLACLEQRPNEKSTLYTARNKLKKEKKLDAFHEMVQWIYSLRRSCYWCVGTATMLEEMFYGNDMIIDALGDSIFSNLDCLFHHQLRPFSSFFFGLFVRNASPNFFGAVVDYLSSYLEFMGARLETEWTAYARRQEGDSNLSEQQEIELDNDIQALTQTYTNFLFSLCPLPGVTSPTSPRLILCQNILANDSTGIPLLQTLVNIMGYPMDVCRRRASRGCQRILPLLGDNQLYCQFAGTEMLSTAITAIAASSQRFVHIDLIQLIRDIYMVLGGYVLDDIRGVMMNLPDISAEALESFEGALQDAKDKRAQNALIRSLLRDIIGVNSVGGPSATRRR